MGTVDLVTSARAQGPSTAVFLPTDLQPLPLMVDCHFLLLSGGESGFLSLYRHPPPAQLPIFVPIDVRKERIPVHQLDSDMEWGLLRWACT